MFSVFQDFCSAIKLYLNWIFSTASEVYAHASSVPAPQQPSIQRASLSNCPQTSRQHVCFPVSGNKGWFLCKNWNWCDHLTRSDFSGSHIENWHSILRKGLVSASYTKLQVKYETLKETFRKWIEFPEDANVGLSTKSVFIYCTNKLSSCSCFKASWSSVWKRHLFKPDFKHIFWIFW